MTADAGRAPKPWLTWLLFAAFAMRLAVLGVLGAHDWYAGGDGPWYVRQGWLIAHDALPSPLRTVGPLYPLVLAAFWKAFPNLAEPIDPLAVSAAYLSSVRIFQAGLGTLTAALVFGVARQLGLSRKSALIASAAIGLGPAFVLEPFLIHTETLFMALVAGALLIYMWGQQRPGAGVMAATGSACALAALTRPVLLLFPAMLGVHLIVCHGWQRGGRLAGALLLAFGVTILPWHVWLYRGTGSWLPEGFAANFFMGSQGDGTPLERSAFHAAEDQLEAAGEGYTGGAIESIRAHPAQWLARRSRNVLAALAQPHGTSDLGGESVKADVARWATRDRSLGALLRIAGAPTFWLKLAIYVSHYAAITMAGIGVWTTWPRRRDWFAIYAVIAYLLVVYGMLTATPRYLFPVEMFVWVLAAAGLDRVGRYTRAAAAGSRSVSAIT